MAVHGGFRRFASWPLCALVALACQAGGGATPQEAGGNGGDAVSSAGRGGEAPDGAGGTGAEAGSSPGGRGGGSLAAGAAGSRGGAAGSGDGGGGAAASGGSGMGGVSEEGGITPAFEGRPNFLFITVDDLAPLTGSYGVEGALTPALDSLATRGLIFDRAYAQAPHCAPSRASFLSGRHPGSSGAPSLPEIFKRGGYATARVGKIFHQGVPDGIGTNGSDNNSAWGRFVNPKGIDVEEEAKATAVPGSLSYHMSDAPEEQHTDALVAAAGIELLRDLAGEPFFLALGFYRPHEPFLAPRRYFDLHPSESIPSPETAANDLADVPLAAVQNSRVGLSAEQARAVRRAYRASVSFVDAQIGNVLAELDRLDLSRRTVVVVLGDHGFALGEHELWKKNLFEVGSRVPLIIAGPGLRRGRRTSALIELLDLYSTLPPLAGLSAPSGFEGADFSAFLRGQTGQGPRRAAVSMCAKRICLTAGKSVTDGRHRYTEWADGSMELYDHEVDPHEFTNLATAVASAAARDSMKRLLESPYTQHVETR